MPSMRPPAHRSAVLIRSAPDPPEDEQVRGAVGVLLASLREAPDTAYVFGESSPQPQSMRQVLRDFEKLMRRGPCVHHHDAVTTALRSG